MAGKKDIVEQALKLVTGASKGGGDEALRRYMSPSHIKDATGNPIRLYHATPNTFDAFNVSQQGDSGPAIFLSPYADRQPAMHNTGGAKGQFKEGTNVMPVYARIQSPLVIDTPDMLEWSRNVYGSEFPHFISPEARKNLIDDGYDGVVFGGYKPQEYATGVDIGKQPHGDEEVIALHPEQVKSAISNEGTYDPADPRINKDAGGRTGYAGKGRVVGSVVGDAVDAAMRLIAGAEPQKTVKAYKLFKQEGGKLYPLFVGANEEVPMNQWVKATAGPQAASGKVKSKIGELAYRPGWHAGDLPIATHIGAKSHGDPSLPPDTRPSNQVWGEVEMANDVDWQKVANERARMTKKGTPDPKTAHITDQVPYGGYYRYKTNPNMTGNWMIGGDMRVNRVLTDDEVKSINEAAGVSDLPRREGYGPGGVIDDIVKMAGKIVSGADEPAKTGIRAYHGTPHDFDKFDISKIGTGEGAQAYGHGLYFAESEPIARHYRDALSNDPTVTINTDEGPKKFISTNEGFMDNEGNFINDFYPGGQIAAKAATTYDTPLGWKQIIRRQAKNDAEAVSAMQLLRKKNVVKTDPGSMYEVNIAADPDQFLDWDKPLSEQPEVMAKLKPLLDDPGVNQDYIPKYTGKDIMSPDGPLAQYIGLRRTPSDYRSVLKSEGIPGIKYLDAGSRGAGDGTRNYVVFDDKLISIIRKYGIAGASAMLGYNLMEQLDPKQALAASMADQDYQSSRPQRSMGGNNSVSGALNVARGLQGGM